MPRHIRSSRRIIHTANFERPFGVIDIGSNSVRLVVFDGPSRAPLTKYNEKVLCGLGRSLDATGRLDKEGVELALAVLSRFAALAREMGVGHFEVVATAAVRDAVDGPDFVTKVRRQAGLDVQILSGAEEARISALGTLSGIPEANGIVGDIGGASLELIEVGDGHTGRSVTLPLGPFRMTSLPPKQRTDFVDEALSAAEWIREARGRNLYLVGGAWRAIARIHMSQTGYPLHIIHHYQVDAAILRDFSRFLARQSAASLAGITGVSPRRLEVLSPAALVLSRLIGHLAPSNVVFSAYGLREGLWYAALSPKQRRQDPLLAACRALAMRESRFGPHGEKLFRFLAPAFPNESEAEGRLRLAASLMSDISWRVSPDYRADQASRRILLAPLSAFDHSARAFVALAVYARYRGSLEGAGELPGCTLIDHKAARRALAIGLGLRFAHTITGGTAAPLAVMRLAQKEGTLVLEIQPKATRLVAETSTRRLESFARGLGLRSEIKIKKLKTGSNRKGKGARPSAAAKRH